MTIKLLYILATLVSLSATVPQVRKLLHARTARELNFGTYITWIATSSVTLLYMLQIDEPILIAASIAWLSYYVVMAAIILYFRRFPEAAPQEVTVQECPQVCDPEYYNL